MQQDISRLVATTDAEESVSRALTIYGALGDDWQALYMVLDSIQKEVGGEKMLIHTGWASKSEIKLFKQPANNYGPVGLDARQGLDEPMRKKPMPIGEARRLLRTLLNKWLVLKGL